MSCWKLTEFQSIPYCNIYSLHILKTEKELHEIVMDINGNVHWLNRSIVIDLKKYLLLENDNLDEFSLELVSTDSFLSAENFDNLFYFATCWVLYDRLFAPECYFGAFFCVSHQFETKLWSKFEVKNVPTFSKLTTISPFSKNLYWLIFSYSQGASVYKIDELNNDIISVDTISDIFPALEIGQMLGSAIRSSCWTAKKYRFSVIGYDTGYVIASVCAIKNGTIIDRKTIKFSGPISLLKLINLNSASLSILILISSTIGPAAVWTLKLEDESLFWEMNTILLNSEICDALLCCAICQDFFFIGTYGEQLLVYNAVDILNSKFCEVFPLFALNIASPILSIEFIETERLLIVLSYKGIHKFSTCCSFNEMLILNTNHSSIPSSPVQTPPPCASLFLSSNFGLSQTDQYYSNPKRLQTQSFSNLRSPLASPTTVNLMSSSNGLWQMPLHATISSTSLPKSRSIPASYTSDSKNHYKQPKKQISLFLKNK